MPAAFRAAFSDVKLVKGRKVAQLIFEIPIEEFDAAYEVLGGMPVSASERWFGIAALHVPQAAKESKQTVAHISPQATSRPVVDKPPSGTKRDWNELQPAQQAGIRCNEPIFAAFLRETRPDDWHEASNPADCVRLICGVHSRVELGTKQAARIIWHQLDGEYSAWLVRERVGA